MKKILFLLCIPCLGLTQQLSTENIFGAITLEKNNIAPNEIP